jgi:hypothetical protein
MTRRLTKAQLEGIVEVLKKPLRPTPPRKETRAELRARVDARREAERRLAEYRSAEARWEAWQMPHVRRELDRRISNAVANVELHAHLRGEPEPLPETASPARIALQRAARSDAEKAREAARLNWPTTEGWMEISDAG